MRSTAEQLSHPDFKSTVRAIRHRCLLCGFVRQFPAPPLRSESQKTGASAASASLQHSAVELPTAAADAHSLEAVPEQASAQEPSKPSKRRRRRRNQIGANKHGLVPYHERMEGSGWADHLKLGPTGATSSEKEKIAAKRHKGGHVLLQTDGIDDLR